jgi:hypothetical protein
MVGGSFGSLRSCSLSQSFSEHSVETDSVDFRRKHGRLLSFELTGGEDGKAGRVSRGNSSGESLYASKLGDEVPLDGFGIAKG